MSNKPEPAPNPKALPWVRCPVCPSDNITRLDVEWLAQSQEPTDRDNQATLVEHVCDDCGTSFWL